MSICVLWQDKSLMELGRIQFVRHLLCSRRFNAPTNTHAGAQTLNNRFKNTSKFKVSMGPMKPLIATAPNEEELQTKIKDARARIAAFIYRHD